MAARSDPPRLRELRDVIPVGRTQTQPPWSVTCLAVERYEDGFKITFRILGAGLWPCHPQLALTVGDDQGGAYRHWGGGGNGATNWVDCDWRLAQICAPAVDPQARELRIIVAEVQRTEVVGPVTGVLDVRVAQRHPGPWVFTITLPQPA